MISKRKIKNVISCLEEILNIINHINNQLVKHSDIYNCKVDKIHISNKIFKKYHRCGVKNLPSLDIDFTKSCIVSPIYTLEEFKVQRELV